MASRSWQVILVIICGVTICLGTTIKIFVPDSLITINTTPSLPLGIYVNTFRSPKIGDIIRIKPLAETDSVYRLKVYVADFTTSAITFDGDNVYLNGTFLCSPVPPFVLGHRYADPDGFFAWAPHPRSDDSRYWGFLPKKTILAAYRPLLIFPEPINENYRLFTN